MRVRLASVLFGLLLAFSALGCHSSLDERLVNQPQALVDSVLANYGAGHRSYSATGQVIVPMGDRHGYFPLRLVLSEPDSARITVERGRAEWARVDTATIQVKRLPGNPLILTRTNVHHVPVPERELYVLLPDVFSWLLDTYRIEKVTPVRDSLYRAICSPRSPRAPTGTIEVDIESGSFRVREIRIYSPAGDLGGKIFYDDFTRRFGYWIPRSIAVDLVARGTYFDELYRILRLQPGSPSPAQSSQMASHAKPNH